MEKVVCILAGGVGNRFGDAVPKQYHLLDGRLVIEYVIAAAVRSSADEILVVADREHLSRLESDHGITGVEGGPSRNHSLYNAVSYLRAQGGCGKLAVLDAVCPLVTAGQIDRYFQELDSCDAVFTTKRIEDGYLADRDRNVYDRDRFLIVQSPDAYRFEMLAAHLRPDGPHLTPLGCLPEGADIRFCDQFPDQVKIVYPRDLAVAEALLRERERRARFSVYKDRTALRLLAKMRSLDRVSARTWEKRVDRDMMALIEQWSVYEFTVYPDAYMGLVLECRSQKYGDCVLKSYPDPLEDRFYREVSIYRSLRSYPLCALYDVDEERKAFLLERVIPGDYIDFRSDRAQIQAMFRQILEDRVEISALGTVEGDIRTVMGYLEEDYGISKAIPWERELMDRLYRACEEIYQAEFAGEARCLLHGDIYYKNALHGRDGIRLIDAFGYQDAWIFETMPFVTYELIAQDGEDGYLRAYEDLYRFFSKVMDVRQFREAVFVFLVRQLIPSIYQGHDDCRRAGTYLRCVRALYLDEEDRVTMDKIPAMPGEERRRDPR